MIELIALTLVFLFALVYVFRHMRKTITVGEDEKCANCPVEKLTAKKTKN